MSKALIPFNHRDIRLREACWIEGRPYFTRRAIGEWLGYKIPQNAIAWIVSRHPHIRDPRWCRVCQIDTPSGVQEHEVYDPIGLQLIVFESKQARAIQYKIWCAHLAEAYARGELVPRYPEPVGNPQKGYQMLRDVPLVEELKLYLSNPPPPGQRMAEIITISKNHGRSQRTGYCYIKSLKQGRDPSYKRYGNRLGKKKGLQRT